MKQVILTLVLILTVSFASAQDKTASMGAFYADSLKTATSRDTVDVMVASPTAYSYYTITAYTAADADTAKVWTLSRDNNVWSQHALIDMNSGNTVTQIVGSTTAKEFIVYDSMPVKIRLITSDHAASIYFVVAGKN